MAGSGIEALVLEVVLAFQEGADIMSTIHERFKSSIVRSQEQDQLPKTFEEMEARFRQQAAQIKEDEAQHKLSEILTNGSLDIRSRYDEYYKYWTVSFRIGDAEIQDMFQTIAAETKILFEILKHARDEAKPLPPIEELQEVANKNRFSAQAALDAYARRLSSRNASMVPPGPKIVAEHSYVEIQPEQPCGPRFEEVGPAISMDGSPATASFVSYVTHDKTPLDTGISASHTPHYISVPTWSSETSAVSPIGGTRLGHMSIPQASLEALPPYEIRPQPQPPLIPYSPASISHTEKYPVYVSETYSHSVDMRHMSTSTTYSIPPPPLPSPPQMQPRTHSLNSIQPSIRSQTVEGGSTDFQGRPNKNNDYHGFCKGAWTVQENVKDGFKVCKRPCGQGLSKFGFFYQCKHCKFEGTAYSSDGKNFHVDPSPYRAKCGAVYKWSFLAKCHLRMKKEAHYRCILCNFDGYKSQAFGDVDTLMYHVVTHHKSMSAERQQRARVILNREPTPHEDFDVCIP